MRFIDSLLFFFDDVFWGINWMHTSKYWRALYAVDGLALRYFNIEEFFLKECIFSFVLERSNCVSSRCIEIEKIDICYCKYRNKAACKNITFSKWEFGAFTVSLAWAVEWIVIFLDDENVSIHRWMWLSVMRFFHRFVALQNVIVDWLQFLSR